MGDLVVAGFVIPETEVDEWFETSGGPGGQHANRNETAVRLRFNVVESSLPEDAKRLIETKLGETVDVVASDQRSQLRNREIARKRLIDRLESALETPKPRKRTRPSQAARNRRLKRKRERSELKRGRRRPSDDE